VNLYGHALETVGLSCEPKANEVFLLHGSRETNIQQILNHGFDDRLNTQTLYGRGVYFTLDACKAAQYCDKDGGALLFVLSRVLLGHYHLPEEPSPQALRPPLVRGVGVPHDSVVARPGIIIGQGKAKGKGKLRQAHWEFVVRDRQAYPELLIACSVT
jgi:hypothetical protein